MSVVVDTDYDSWAVVAQCRQGASPSSPEPTFLSTRVLARRRRIDTADRWLQVSARTPTHMEAHFPQCTSLVDSATMEVENVLALRIVDFCAFGVNCTSTVLHFMHSTQGFVQF